MGKKGRKNNPSPAAPADEDALLAAAIARAEEEQKAWAEEEQRKAAAAEKAALQVALTQQQVIDKMNAVPVFRVIHRVAGDKGYFVCTRTPSDPEGHPGLPTWYTDLDDAQKALEATQAACPDESFEITPTPLGVAVALSEGWANGQKSFRIQGSQSVLDGLSGKEHKVPEDLAAKMNPSTGPIPLFSLRTLATETVHPVFFSREDLARTWKAAGRDLDDLPGDDELTTTDLRMLVVRTLATKNDWRPLKFVPPEASVAFCNELHQQAVARGDEPPPLTAAVAC